MINLVQRLQLAFRGQGMMRHDECIYESVSSNAKCGVAVANWSVVLFGRTGRHFLVDSYHDRELFSEYVSKSICNMHFLILLASRDGLAQTAFSFS